MKAIKFLILVTTITSLCLLGTVEYHYSQKETVDVNIITHKIAGHFRCLRRVDESNSREVKK